MRKIYLLVGEEACNALTDIGFDALVDLIKENLENDEEFEFTLFKYNEEEPVKNILSDMRPHGLSHVEFLNRSEYEELNKLKQISL